MMETALAILLILMIIGSVYALHAKDLLSAIVAFALVGFGNVIAFLMLMAPDLAIVQIVVETITLIITIAVLIICTREDLSEKNAIRVDGISYVNIRSLVYFSAMLIIVGFLTYYFWYAASDLRPFGAHVPRMAKEYIEHGLEKTGSVNLVTGVLFDFRGYDTLGEATIMFTAVIGVLTIMRLRGRKV